MTPSTPSSLDSASFAERARTDSIPRDLSSWLSVKRSAGSSSTSSTRAIVAPLDALHRQGADGRGPATRLAGVLERAAVLRERGARHHHAQAGALLAGGEEGRSQANEHLRRHPAAIVAHRDPCRALDLGNLDVDLAAVRARLDGVADQVEEGVLEPPWTGLDHGIAAPAPDAAGRVGARAHQRERLAGQRAQR